MTKQFFLSWFFLSLVGVACAGAFIWFLGDLFAFGSFRPFASSWVRATFIILILLVWSGWALLRVHRSRQQNKSLLDEPAQGMPGNTQDDAALRSRKEAAELKQRFEEAIAKLKTLRLTKKTGRSQYLYELPWYALIGAPGSGKTTALENAGLRFPLMQSGTPSLVNVDGTRHCEWWLADEAVLLDTAGRYTAHQCEAMADQAAWLGFLQLLKKVRKRLPLNGLIVTLSVQDLLLGSVAERAAHATTIRARVSELYEQLGVRIPIYVLVTKTDLLAGFSEFFADLGREQRQQVWGATLAVDVSESDGADYAGRMREEFAALTRALQERTFARFNQESDRERRISIYGFPEQFRLLASLVGDFIAEAFAASTYSQQPMLRGAYFTSATQGGMPLPIDRVFAVLSQKMAMPAPVAKAGKTSGAGKSLFLTHLLRDVIFNEAGLAGLNQKAHAVRRRLMQYGIAAVVIMVGLSLAGWSWSFWQNQKLISDTDQRIRSAAAHAKEIGDGYDDTTLIALIKVLDELRALPYGAGRQDSTVHLLERLGLSQLDQVKTKGDDVYRRAIAQALLPRLAYRLEEQLTTARSPVIQYEMLKAYLMLFDVAHLEPESFKAWMLASVEASMVPREWMLVKERFSAHLDAVMQTRPWQLPVGPNTELVASVRMRLAQVPLPDRVMARIKLIGIGTDIPGFRVTDAAGPSANSVLLRASGKPLSEPVPALYTFDGFHKQFVVEAERAVKQLAEEESWVLAKASGRSKAPEALQVLEEVKRRYMVEYIRVWDDLLADIRLARATSMAETLVMLRTLGAADSPYKKLLIAIARETSLTRGRNKDFVGSKVDEIALDGARKLISQTGLDSQSLFDTHRATRAESAVDEHFETLRRFALPPAAGQPAPIDDVLAALMDAYRELSAMGATVAASTALATTPQSLVRLKVEADRVPVAVQGLLKSIAAAASGQSAAAGKEMFKAALSMATLNCEKIVVGRYPLARNAKADIPYDDFNRIFAPGGELDDFFSKHLEDHVDMTGSMWRAKAGTPNPLPASTIRSFEQAAAIKNAFFRMGLRSATSVADVMLVGSDGNGVVLEYDGRSTILGAGADSSVRIEWPPRSPAPSARLYFTKTSQIVSAEGLWAIFRLLDQGHAESKGDRVRFDYQIDGKKVQLEMHIPSVNNPFRLPALEGFQCPRV